MPPQDLVTKEGRRDHSLLVSNDRWKQCSLGLLPKHLSGPESACGWRAIQDSYWGCLQAVLTLYGAVAFFRLAYAQRGSGEVNEDQVISMDEFIIFIYFNLWSLVLCGFCRYWSVALGGRAGVLTVLYHNREERDRQNKAVSVPHPDDGFSCIQVHWLAGAYSLPVSYVGYLLIPLHVPSVLKVHWLFCCPADTAQCQPRVSGPGLDGRDNEKISSDFEHSGWHGISNKQQYPLTKWKLDTAANTAGGNTPINGWLLRLAQVLYI